MRRYRWWSGEWVWSIDGMNLTGEEEVWSTGSKHTCYWHFVHHRSLGANTRPISTLSTTDLWEQTHVLLALCPPQISHRTGLGLNLNLCDKRPWFNCVSHGTVFTVVTLCSMVGGYHQFRWHYHEDGDVCTRPYGVTSQEALILTLLQWPQWGAVAVVYHYNSLWLRCILRTVELDLCLWPITAAFLLLCFRFVFQCASWSLHSTKVRRRRVAQRSLWPCRNVEWVWIEKLLEGSAVDWKVANLKEQILLCGARSFLRSWPVLS